MKKLFISALVFLAAYTSTSVFAQPNVLDPNDPDVVFTASNQPAVPTYNKISKWGHTARLSWNPYSYGYKSYYFKGMAFRIKFPKTYQHNVADGKKYPSVLFLHGLGEPGPIYDNEYHLVHGGQFHAEQIDKGNFDGFMIYPQSQAGYLQSYFPVMRDLLDSLVKYVKLDIDRINVGGLSSGGQAAWDILQSPINAKYVAGLEPISAAAYEDVNYFASHISVPILLANGGQDVAPYPSTVTDIINSYKNLGGDITQCFFPEQGHGAWNAFWSDPRYIPFINSTHKANPLVYFQHYKFCPNESVSAKLGLQAGFYSYEWQKDGLTINGQTSNILMVSTYGTYRARFKRTASSAWSDWSPAPAVISQNQGTVTPDISVDGLRSFVLPAPDGSSTVPLSVPNTYASYEWRRVSDNALVSSTNTYNAPIGQFKVKVTEQFGCGSDFSPIFKVIPANGGQAPDMATSVAATPISNSAVQLDWNDNPNPAYNETNFEIYRSKTPGAGYSLVGKTNTDVLSFLDEGLSADTKYYYIIRAINNNGASVISPEVSALTQSDITAPTAPLNLVVTGSTRSSVSLSWGESTDDVGVSRYEIYIDGVKKFVTTNTSFTVNGLAMLQTYGFYVRAVDATGNVSPTSNQVSGTAALNGLSYKYYEGSWNNLPDFSTLTPILTGVSPNVTLTPKLAADNFGFLWEGFIKIPANGTYKFETNSDDGSKLYFGNYDFNATALVDNDGLHGGQYREGSITLTAGIYPIAISFFEKTGGEAMNVYWTCAAAGIPTRTAIPNSAFVDNVTILPSQMPKKPSNLIVAASAYNRVNISWTDESNNETGFEVSRSTSLIGTYTNIGSVAAGVTTFVDSVGLEPSTKYFYKVRSVNQYGQSDFISFLEAQWSLDQDLFDGSGNNRNLTLTNNPPYSTDRKEGSHSISLNGSNQYINLPFAASKTFPAEGCSTRTIALWIKPIAAAVSGTNKVIFDFGGNDNGIALRFNAGALQAGIAGGSNRQLVSVASINTNPNWNVNNWNHVAVVYDVNKLQLYANGVLLGTTNLGFTSIGSSTNASRIGATNSSNAFNSSTSSTNVGGLLDDITVITEPLTAAGLLALMTQTYTSDTTFELPAMPASPTNLVSTAQTTKTVSLQFNDNSANETLFEVYRSAGTNNNFRQLATIPGAAGLTKALIDSNLFSNTNYYYKVRAKGVGGTTAFTATLLVRTANNVPVMAEVGNFTMRYASQKIIQFSATDADLEALAYTSLNALPAFATLTDGGNGTASLKLNPTQAQQGVYPVQIQVADGNNGRDTVSFNITVNANYTPVITALNNLNVAESSTANVTLAATDLDGNASITWSLATPYPFISLADNGNGAGQLVIAPGFTHAGVYPVTVVASDNAGASENATFTLTVTNQEPPVERWFMSMKYNSPNAPAPWNTISTPTTNSLKNASGLTTSLGIQFMNTSWNAGDAGAVTGNNSGVYPDAVIKDYFWFGVYGAPNTIDIKLNGLTPGTKYNITLFGSSAWRGLGNNGTTIYTLNGVAKPLYVDMNNQNTVTFSAITPDGSGNIIVNMTKGASTPYGMVNAIVIEKPFDDGTAPAVPANLIAQAQSNGSVKLEWDDVAYNESSYRVHRATSADGPFTLMNPGASNANDTTYNDNTVQSTTTYYYKVEAVNGVGSSGFSNVAVVSTTNKAPMMGDIADVYVKAANSVTVNFAATDDAGDIMTTTVTNLPAFANFQVTGNGAAKITFNPSASDMGYYPGIVVTVTDNSGASVSKVFNATVTDNSVRTAYLNFGPEGSTAQAAPWNNYLGYPFKNNVYGSIKDDANVTTNFTFKFLTQWNGGLSFGMRTGDNTGVFPDNVMRTSFHNYNTGSHVIEFGGLDPAKRYSIGFLTNSHSGAASPVTFTSGAQSITIDGRYNTDKLVNLNGLVPNASGIVQVTLVKNSTNQVLSLNAVVIREYLTTDPVIRPSDLIAHTVLQNDKISLTWSDRSGDETGFQIWRSTAADGTYTLVSTTAANVNSYTNSGLTANTRYYYKVRAVKGATYSNYSNISNAILAQNIVLINQNVSASQSGASPWNNTSSPSTIGATFSNLNNTALVNTGFEMVITKEFNGTGYAGVNANGVFPANVQVSNYWTDAGQTSAVQFQNLDISKKYRIGCFGSNTNSNYTTGNYSCNGKTVELNSYYNDVKVVYLDKLTPNADGKLIVSVSTAGGSPYSFTGAFTIEYYDDNTPAEPVVNTIYSDGVPQGRMIAGKGGHTLPQPEAVVSTAKPSVPSVKTEELADVISVFPNPFTDRIQVELQNPKASAVTIMLYDINGSLLFKTNNMNVMKGNNIVSANLPVGIKLAPGMYVINVWIDGKMSKSVKLIKVN